MTSQIPRQRNVRSTCTTVIGWSLVATGAGHTALVAVGSTLTPPAEERAVRATMAATSIPVAGMERTYWDLFQGFSLVMALMLVGLGSLVLLVQRSAPELVQGSRVLLVLLGLVLVPAVVISVLLLPPPPIVLLGLAAVAVVVALVQGPGHRQRDGAGGQRQERLAVGRDQADARTPIK
jgi:hypothetical protein